MTALAWQDGAAGRFDVDGKSLEYGMFGPPPGEGPTIVLLHEGLGCLALWRDFPARLSAALGLGVFAWSREGYGGSARVPPPWPLDYMTTEAVERLPLALDALGAGPVILFGHSDGATIASEYAGRAEDARIKGLVLMAPHFFTEPGGQASIRATHEAFLAGPLRERLAKYHASADDTFLGWSGAWLDPKFEGRWRVDDVLGGIEVPTLALQGADDEYGTLAHIEALQAASQGPVQVEIIPDCRHSPHLERPDAVLAAVKAFVAGLDGA